MEHSCHLCGLALDRQHDTKEMQHIWFACRGGLLLTAVRLNCELDSVP
jgi:hypothetical protein